MYRTLLLLKLSIRPCTTCVKQQHCTIKREGWGKQGACTQRGECPLPVAPPPPAQCLRCIHNAPVPSSPTLFGDRVSRFSRARDDGALCFSGFRRRPAGACARVPRGRLHSEADEVKRAMRMVAGPVDTSLAHLPTARANPSLFSLSALTLCRANVPLRGVHASAQPAVGDAAAGGSGPAAAARGDAPAPSSSSTSSGEATTFDMVGGAEDLKLPAARAATGPVPRQWTGRFGTACQLLLSQPPLPLFAPPLPHSLPLPFGP